MNEVRPCGCPMKHARVYRSEYGHRAVCSCCGMAEDVVTLPQGPRGNRTADFCIACLHGGSKPIATGPFAATKFRDEPIKVGHGAYYTENGVSHVDFEHIPRGLVRFLRTGTFERGELKEKRA